MRAVPSSRRPSTLVLLAAFATLVVFSACQGEGTPDAATPGAPGAPTIGHLYQHGETGVMIDLPTSWKGRFAVADSVTRPVNGLQREIALRYVKADSAADAQTPMLVAYLFDKAAWAALPSDSARAAFGDMLAEDATRALVVRRATATPYAAGTRDAGAYDSLMTALYQRPLRAVLRAP
jgi:hypothetical protein